MQRPWTPLPLLAILLVGCAVTDTQSAAPRTADEPAEAADPARERADLERKLAIARARLELAELEASAFEHRTAARLQQSQAEVELAQDALTLFRDGRLPQRLATERLDLQTTRDRAQEALDELAQIEIMYKEQDLDDLTAEFVVSRGRRQAERAQARIEIAEAALKVLEERELPQEVERLELAVAKAHAELEAGELDARVGRKGKAIAVQEARHAVEEVAAKLTALEEDGQ
jgi:hypothetical protein